jgi:alpha-1,2-glucosyltransferase
VFHVPQAKRYCNGDYTWDPKITTPPGLQVSFIMILYGLSELTDFRYLVSLLIKPVLGGCDTPLLRLLNVGAICLICILAYDTLRILHARIPTNDDGQSGNSNNNHATIEDQDQDSAFNAHSALNISLFPPLFFFSGLYYTDVMSTLLVLLSYNVFLKRDRHERRLWDDFASVVIGALAVSFRQTNIFWVAVFPAGLAVFDALRHRTAPTQEIAQKTILYRIENGFSKLTVYDPPIRHASFMNNLVLLESTGLLALRRPFLIVKVIAPYFLLVGLFAGFVFWNGGVVLGKIHGNPICDFLLMA